MTGKLISWRTAGALSLALLTAGPALAGPEDGPLLRHRDCPRSDYSPLHYWAPTLYVVRAFVHPSNQDQYAPGPSPPVAPTYDVQRFRCRTMPATPGAPYADPTSYYGRPIAPP